MRLTPSTRRLLREASPGSPEDYYTRARIRAELFLSRHGYHSPPSVSARLSMAERDARAKYQEAEKPARRVTLGRTLREARELREDLDTFRRFFNWRAFDRDQSLAPRPLP